MLTVTCFAVSGAAELSWRFPLHPWQHYMYYMCTWTRYHVRTSQNDLDCLNAFFVTDVLIDWQRSSLNIQTWWMSFLFLWYCPLMPFGTFSNVYHAARIAPNNIFRGSIGGNVSKQGIFTHYWAISCWCNVFEFQCYCTLLGSMWSDKRYCF